MRINKFVALASSLSRRASDQAINSGQVSVNGKTAGLGQQVAGGDIVKLDGRILKPAEKVLIILNKPVGYICSRNGQGGKTIYDLLPAKYHNLNPVGRLDKDSSGLLLLTNDGRLAQRLTHPKYGKEKTYEVGLDKPLSASDKAKIEQGIKLDDGISKLKLSGSGKNLIVRMSEGRNRQIRRTFAALDYEVNALHRTQFGDFGLMGLAAGSIKKL